LYDQSVLHYAIQYSNDIPEFKIVKYLIKSGANINLFDINGITPLHVAINRKIDELCDYLLDQGALINVVDK
jgi:ankyrin repeat protein